MLWLRIGSGLLLGLLLAAANTTRMVEFDDLSLNEYTRDGEIAQLAYARQAIQTKPPLIALLHRHRARAVRAYRLRHPALIRGDAHAQSMTAFGDRRGQTLCCSVGHQPDCRAALLHLHQLTVEHTLKFAEHPTGSYLSDKLAKWLVRGIYSTSGSHKVSRPLAASTLIIQVIRSAESSESNMLTCYQVEPSGVVREAEGLLVVGNVPLGLQKQLEELYQSHAGKIPESEELCAAILKALAAEGFDHFEVGAIDRHGNAKITSGDLSQIESQLI